jgi:hypothetical protein
MRILSELAKIIKKGCLDFFERNSSLLFVRNFNKYAISGKELHKRCVAGFSVYDLFASKFVINPLDRLIGRQVLCCVLGLPLLKNT